MRLTRWTRLPLALGVLLLACDRSESGPKQAGAPGPEPAAGSPAAPATAPPRMLVFHNDQVAATKGAPLAPVTPLYDGGTPVTYRIKPVLPEGLTFDPRTGTIAGTPTKLAARTPFEVTAMNGMGSLSAVVNLTVNDAGPAAPPEVTVAPYVTAGLGAPTASTKDLGEGYKYEWRVNGGDLVSGQGTASIVFKAAEEGTVTFDLKVANSGGSATARGETRVVPKPEANLTLPGSVRPNEDWMTVSVKAQEGMTYAWSILPGSSGASIVDGQGTNTIRYRTNPAFGTFQIQVTVTNQAGDTASAIGPVQVLPY